MGAVLDGSSISTVLDVYQPERTALLDLLCGLEQQDWAKPTECPAYSVKGVATHILGDDLSLLSRQRDAAANGLVSLGSELPDVDFRTLLDTFNDRWVATASFLSGELLIQLLRLSGEWTEAYYKGVDPHAPGESVGIFGAREGQPSPFWQAIAREYLERWIHHSQIRRALGLSSLDDQPLFAVGIEVVGAALGMQPVIPSDDDSDWGIGELLLGPRPQAATILTLGYTPHEVQHLLRGPSALIKRLARAFGRQ
jgi:uncharacterized protein (TIGR03083 family)